MADRDQSSPTPARTGAFLPPGSSRITPDARGSANMSASDGAVRIDRPASPSQRESEGRSSSATATQQSSPAASAVQEARSQAADMKDKAAAEAGRVAQDAAQTAKVAGQRMRARGAELVGQQKRAAAGEIAHIGQALHAAAETLRQKDDRYSGDIAEAAAERIEMLASYLRDRDLSSLARDVEGVARRRPELFYGGLFAVGLAAGRFLKASKRSQT